MPRIAQLALPLGLALTTATLATAAPKVATPQTLFFDAAFTKVSTAGPSANHVGHLQIASGILHDASGRSVGRFAFTCRWTQILPNDDALEHLEHCTGWAETREGRLDAAGPSRRSDTTHQWTITGLSGAYMGAVGSVVTRDLGDTESLLTVTITPRSGVTLRVGVFALPAANNSFRARANALCTAAGKQLATLPSFPFSNFDPTHPDPKLLPQVGRFFTGPGDPRPIIRRLDAALHALGQPPANPAGWKRLLAALGAAIAVRTEQDNAALAANTHAFVDSLKDVDRSTRQLAITATTFGTTTCIP
jgi:hypothetical protein